LAHTPTFMVIGQPINNSQSIGCPKWHQT